MALLFMEGFDAREPKARAGMGLASNITAFVPGRGGFGYAAFSSSGSNNITIPVTTESAGTDEFVFSVSHKIDTISNKDMPIFVVPQASGNSCNASLGSDRRLQVTYGDTLFNTSFFATPGAWHRYEMEVKLTTAATGYFRFWVDGELIHGASNVVTQSNYRGLFNGVTSYFGRYGTHFHYIDDLYILSKTGPAPFNNRLGDVRIETITPNGNGANSNFVGSDGNSTNNFELVDEVPTSAADYVTSTGVGNIDTYTMSDVTQGAPLCIQTHYSAKKTGAGDGSLIPITIGGGQTRTDSPLGLTTTSTIVSGPIQTDDPAGAPWSASTVNAVELGFESGA